MDNHRRNDGLLTVNDVSIASSCSFVTVTDLYNMLRCVTNENVNENYDEFAKLMISFVRRYGAQPSTNIYLRDRYFGRLWMRLTVDDFYERVAPMLLFFPLVTIYKSRFPEDELTVTVSCLCIVLSRVSNELLTNTMSDWRRIANYCVHLFHLCMDIGCAMLAVPFSLFESREVVECRGRILYDALQLRLDGDEARNRTENIANSRALAFMICCRKVNGRVTEDLQHCRTFLADLLNSSLANMALREILFARGILYFVNSHNRNLPPIIARTIHSYFYGLTYRFVSTPS